MGKCESMNKSIVDIFLVTYNRAEYLGKSIKSILDQSYSAFNLIILDNCSTDHTETVVESFDDSRIHYVRHNKNIGGIGNINYAISHATNKYFMIFHDDDIMYDSLVERQINIMDDNPELAIVSCKSDCIDSEGNIIEKNVLKGYLEKYRNGEFFLKYLYNQNFILFPAIMYRTEFMKSNDILLKEEVGPSADVFMCFEIERNNGCIAILNQSLMAYRKHCEQDSDKNRVEMIVQLFSVLKHNLYYGAILEKNDIGQKKYYRWLMRNEVCMVAKKTVTCEEAQKTKMKYEKILNYGKIDSLLYSMILLDMKYIGIFSKIYWFYKNTRGRNR